MGLEDLSKGWFILVLLLVSAAWWVEAISRWFSTGEPIVPRRESQDQEPPRNPLAVILTLSWLGLVAFGAASGIWDQVTQQKVKTVEKITKIEAAPNTEDVETETGPDDKPKLTVDQIFYSALNSGFLLILLLASLTELGKISLDDLGMEFDNTLQDFTWAIRGTLAACLPVFLVQLCLHLTQIRQPDNQHQLLQLLEQDNQFRTVSWIFLSAVVIAPMLEELLFRVILQRWLTMQIGAVGGVLITAVLFGFVHGWPDMLPLFPLALVLGYLYHRQARYWMVVILHMLFNLMNFLMALLTQGTA